jgi:hypothetical protein
MSIAVVVPTIRPELFLKFLDAWKPLFEKHEVTLYVLEDHAEKSFTIPKQSFTVVHYCWKDIDDALGDKAWIIPRQTCAIKSFGYYAAYKAGFSHVFVLDDDCMPDPYNDVLEEHMDVLTEQYFIEQWFDVGQFISSPNRVERMHRLTRGFPYQYRQKLSEALWSVGGWDNVPDFDGMTQASLDPVKDYEFAGTPQAVPKGFGCTYCGMNMVLDTRLTPAFYYQLNGEKYGIDRTDDIYSGYFIKRICDHLGYATVINPYATVVHTRASNTLVNIKKEASSLATTEVLWDHVKAMKLTGTTFKDCYIEIANQLDPKIFHTEEYGNKLKEAMRIWAELF